LPSADEALQSYLYVLVVGAGISAMFFAFEKNREKRAAVEVKQNPPDHSADPLGQEERSVTTPSSKPQAAPPARAAALFLDRLPPELGSELIALEMEDHYVRAHTVLGSDLVLLRMRDAIAELDGLEGAQVHRSWWVARGAVDDVRKDGRNIRLVLDNGLEAPGSRANITPLKEQGWF
jgi:DNA-binding LytR/AlgR family response regulator